MQGLVLKSTGSFYRVLCGDQELTCKLSGKLRLDDIKHTNPVSVGDWVEVLPEGVDQGTIQRIEPRKNYLIRKATNLSKQTHIVAANMDQLWIVASLAKPRTSTGFIDRLLVTAEAYSIQAALIFNKIDLLNDRQTDDLNELADLYRSIGYPVYLVNAFDPACLAALRAEAIGKVTLFSGHSGVGKSTLMNGMFPGLDIRTGAISDKFEKGKHTTTFAEMHPLTEGGYLIDTPGIKEFGLYEMEPWEIGDYFPEFLAVKSQCRFNNCLHENEPHCAVLEALEAGEIAESRYINYLNFLHPEERL